MQPLNRRERMQAILAVIGLLLVSFALFYGGSAAAVALAVAAAAVAFRGQVPKPV